VTVGTDTTGFEGFQGRVGRATAVTATVLVAAAVVGSGGFTPVAGGLALGAAAGVVSHAIKVRTLRGIERAGAGFRTGWASLATLVRLAVCGAALAVAHGSPQADFWATVGGLVLANAVTVVLAVRDSRRAETQT
jgi:hypothetical protein